MSCPRTSAILHTYHRLTMKQPRQPLGLRCRFGVMRWDRRRSLSRPSAIHDFQCERKRSHRATTQLDASSMASHSPPSRRIDHLWSPHELHCIDRSTDRMTAGSLSCHWEH
ncbi:MAG: hypothetical protein E6J34_19305 [Chloroflexi bacterium]|nr:MAG: hypothetical protein E6J34_19305 [Chloroflexota bacterium]